MKNTGTLRIQTFAARQSAPVEGVTVTVQGDAVSYTHLEISLRADKISTQVSRSCCRKLRSTCIPSTLGRLRSSSTTVSYTHLFEQEQLSDVCPCCGKPAKAMVYWGVAY